MNQSSDSQPFQVMKIIWFALLCTQFILIFLAFQTSSSAGPSEVQTIDPRIFFFLGCFILLISFVLPNFFMKSILSQKQEFKIQDAYFTPFVLSIALNEACAVLAFLIKKTSNHDQMTLILFGLSIAAFIFKFPTEDRIRSKINKLKNMEIR